MVKEIEEAGDFSFDTETSGLNTISSSLVGISFSCAENKAWYIPLGHREGSQLSISNILEILNKLFTNENLSSCAHNANFDRQLLEQMVDKSGLSFPKCEWRCTLKESIRF